MNKETKQNQTELFDIGVKEHDLMNMTLQDTAKSNAFELSNVQDQTQMFVQVYV